MLRRLFHTLPKCILRRPQCCGVVCGAVLPRGRHGLPRGQVLCMQMATTAREEQHRRGSKEVLEGGDKHRGGARHRSGVAGKHGERSRRPVGGGVSRHHGRNARSGAVRERKQPDPPVRSRVVKLLPKELRQLARDGDVSQALECMERDPALRSIGNYLSLARAVPRTRAEDVAMVIVAMEESGITPNALSYSLLCSSLSATGNVGGTYACVRRALADGQTMRPEFYDAIVECLLRVNGVKCAALELYKLVQIHRKKPGIEPFDRILARVSNTDEAAVVAYPLTKLIRDWRVRPSLETARHMWMLPMNDRGRIGSLVRPVVSEELHRCCEELDTCAANGAQPGEELCERVWLLLDALVGVKDGSKEIVFLWERWSSCVFQNEETREEPEQLQRAHSGVFANALLRTSLTASNPDEAFNGLNDLFTSKMKESGMTPSPDGLAQFAAHALRMYGANADRIIEKLLKVIDETENEKQWLELLKMEVQCSALRGAGKGLKALRSAEALLEEQELALDTRVHGHIMVQYAREENENRVFWMLRQLQSAGATVPLQFFEALMAVNSQRGDLDGCFNALGTCPLEAQNQEDVESLERLGMRMIHEAAAAGRFEMAEAVLGEWYEKVQRNGVRPSADQFNDLVVSFATHQQHSKLKRLVQLMDQFGIPIVARTLERVLVCMCVAAPSDDDIVWAMERLMMGEYRDPKRPYKALPAVTLPPLPPQPGTEKLNRVRREYSALVELGVYPDQSKCQALLSAMLSRGMFGGAHGVQEWMQRKQVKAPPSTYYSLNPDVLEDLFAAESTTQNAGGAAASE